MPSPPTEHTRTPGATGMTAPSVMTWGEVLALTGLSRNTVLASVRAGRFPPPRRLSVSRVAFLRSEVVSWLESRPVAVCLAGDDASSGTRSGRST